MWRWRLWRAKHFPQAWYSSSFVKRKWNLNLGDRNEIMSYINARVWAVYSPSLEVLNRSRHLVCLLLQLPDQVRLVLQRPFASLQEQNTKRWVLGGGDKGAVLHFLWAVRRRWTILCTPDLRTHWSWNQDGFDPEWRVPLATWLGTVSVKRSIWTWHSRTISSFLCLTHTFDLWVQNDDRSAIEEKRSYNTTLGLKPRLHAVKASSNAGCNGKISLPVQRTVDKSEHTSKFRVWSESEKDSAGSTFHICFRPVLLSFRSLSWNYS